MAYQYKGKPDAVASILNVEQERRRNAALQLEFKTLTVENAEIDKRIRLMRDELTVAYRKLRRQVHDLDAVRAQEHLVAESKRFESKLPAPIYGGREGLEAATEEMLAHESRGLKLSKPIPPPKGPSHGTQRRYEKGCRCPECTDCNVRHVARFRSNRKRRQTQTIAA